VENGVEKHVHEASAGIRQEWLARSCYSINASAESPSLFMTILRKTRANVNRRVP
jgi:hypothetical protein